MTHAEQIVIAVELRGFKDRDESEALVSDWTLARRCRGPVLSVRPEGFVV
jgi:hypothetical protein